MTLLIRIIMIISRPRDLLSTVHCSLSVFSLNSIGTLCSVPSSLSLLNGFHVHLLHFCLLLLYFVHCTPSVSRKKENIFCILIINLTHAAFFYF